MITLLLVIFIILTIVGYFIDWETLGIFFGVCSLALLIWVVSLCISLGTAFTIDEKIALYEEENSKIEAAISTTVSNYMVWEADTYREFKVESPITLIPCIPELNSDELVKEQIKVYTENNREIRSLKEKKINLAKKRWKLYFGH